MAKLAAGADRIEVTLHAGDVLVLPTQWWHTTLHDGREPSIAVSVWFKARAVFFSSSPPLLPRPFFFSLSRLSRWGRWWWRRHDPSGQPA